MPPLTLLRDFCMTLCVTFRMTGLVMLVMRGSVWHLIRRVPKRYAGVSEQGRQVSLSLRTDSRIEAEAKAKAAWDALLMAWEARLRGDTTDARARYDAALNICAQHGYRYQSLKQIMAMPVEDQVERINRIPQRMGEPNKVVADALLGVTEPPKMTLSETLAEFRKSVEPIKTLKMTPDQLRKYRNPRDKAFRNFIAVVGDIPLADLTRTNLIEFRSWWLTKIQEEDLQTDSANKDFTHLKSVIEAVIDTLALPFPSPFGGKSIKFPKSEAEARPEFSTDWIKQKLLAPKALDGLNDEARGILLAMINTGARPSELCALRPEDIKLTDNIPHICISAAHRRTKTRNSVRQIPLLGVSLEAMQRFPNGFPRYDDKAATLSATVNKYLREAGLMETENHTLYCLRHRLEGVLRRAGADGRVRRMIFGHARNADVEERDRPDYGQVHLVELQDALRLVAI